MADCTGFNLTHGRVPLLRPAATATFPSPRCRRRRTVCPESGRRRRRRWPRYSCSSGRPTCSYVSYPTRRTSLVQSLRLRSTRFSKCTGSHWPRGWRVALAYDFCSAWRRPTTATVSAYHAHSAAGHRTRAGARGSHLSRGAMDGTPLPKRFPVAFQNVRQAPLHFCSRRGGSSCALDGASQRRMAGRPASANHWPSYWAGFSLRPV